MQTLSMDKAKRSQRIQDKIVNRLVFANFIGVRRGELVNYASHNDYRRGAMELDQMCSEGKVDRVDGRYQLGIPIVDEVACHAPQWAYEFFNLDLPGARRLREQRIATYGEDVLVYEDHPRQLPPYTSRGWPLTGEGVLNVVARPDNPMPGFDPVPDPKPKPVDFWAIPELELEPELEPAASFWA